MQCAVLLLLNTTQNGTVATLNGFLRESSPKWRPIARRWTSFQTSPARVELEQCRRSHEQRVARLRHEVIRLGGTPEEGSRAWRAIPKLVEGTATVFGEKAAHLGAGGGEDHGLKLCSPFATRWRSSIRQPGAR